MRERGLGRTSSSAIRSVSSPRSQPPARSRTGAAIGLVRERGLAMAEAARQRPGAMAAILGLADEEVEKLCRRIVGVWPANYNCPGQVVVSGEHDAVEECCAEAAEPRRPTSRDAQGLGGVPQPARRESGGPAAASARAGPVRRAALAVHVDRHGEDRTCAEACDAARRPADRHPCGSRRLRPSSSAAARRRSSRSGRGTCSQGSSSGSIGA